MKILLKSKIIFLICFIISTIIIFSFLLPFGRSIFDDFNELQIEADYQKQIGLTSKILESIKTERKNDAQRILKIKEYKIVFYTNIDLNIDGKFEKIELRAYTNDESFKKYSRRYLFVNNTLIYYISHHKNFLLVDINTNDNYKEIAFPIPLANNWEEVGFFTVKDSKIVKVGVIPGIIISKSSYTNISEIYQNDYNFCDGSGNILTSFSGNLLKKVFFTPKYTLNKKHQIEKIPQKPGVYNINIQLKMKTNLPVYSLNDLYLSNPKPIHIFKSNETIKLTQTDNQNWFLAENSNFKGYFGVTNFYIIKRVNKFAGYIFNNLYKSERIDLNGDRREEEIFFVEKPMAVNRMVIFVNNNEFGPFYDAEIIDIDKNDKIKEIRIWYKYAEFDDYSYSTEFFYYDGKKLVSMGNFPNAIVTNNNVKVTYKSKILPNWSYIKCYKLDSNHLLIPIEEGLYNVNKKFILNDYLPLLKSQNDTTYFTILKPDEEVTVLATDENKWCLIKSENGIEGWYKIEENSFLFNYKYLFIESKN